MSKEEFLNIQTCVLKVNIHCDGCKHKVKKILHKIEGVYTTKIDAELGKVTVSGSVDSSTLIKKLSKKGKHAEIWGAPKATNNNPPIDKLGDKTSKDNGQKGNNPTANNQPKALAGLPPLGPTPQQLQQMKGFQDLKMPPDFMKMMPQLGGANFGKGQIPNQKPGDGGKPGKPPLALPEDESMSDDDYDEDDYDDEDEDDYDDEEEDDDEDDYDDELDGPPMNKAPVKGNGLGPKMPDMLMKGLPMLPGNPGKDAKNVSFQMNHDSGGAKKGDNGGKGGGGGPPDGKAGGGGGGTGGQSKYGGGGGGGAAAGIHNIMANGAKKGDGISGMPNMMMAMNGGGGGGGGGGPMGNMMPMGHMGNNHLMGNQGAIQGMPSMNGGGVGRPALPEQMAGNGNPYQQQQMVAAMMNQQRGNGNEMYHPMMYARPQPAVNYMQPYPPYPYPPPPGERVDQYSMFSDENTSSCSVM